MFDKTVFYDTHSPESIFFSMENFWNAGVLQSLKRTESYVGLPSAPLCSEYVGMSDPTSVDQFREKKKKVKKFFTLLEITREADFAGLEQMSLII